MFHHITWLETQLFENIENYGLETLLKVLQEGNFQNKYGSMTKLTLKQVKWDKDLRIVKIDEKDLEVSQSNEEQVDDPGPSPPY
jgi:hypothetical protein